MKTLLENKTHIQFIRECVSCKISAEINLPEITEGSIITLEHRFNYDDELRIADVAHTLNGEIKVIYEICHTHKTCSENRPEPWVEIDANSLLTLVNTNNEPLIINCIRCEKCEECIEKEKIQIKKKKDKFKKDRSKCFACRGSGTSYWSDDCYGSCLECCCINCGEFDDECECKYCKKCESSYMKDEEHKCYLCEKCGKYEQYESCLKDHCKECCNCNKKYDTITINEFYTSQKCCECRKDLKHYKDTKGVEIYRLFTCSNCVSCENKNVVFRTRDKNSAINILNLTECWIHNQTRPVEFQFQASSFTCRNKKTGVSKTIGVKKQQK
jgi:hypothetical protein